MWSMARHVMAALLISRAEARTLGLHGADNLLPFAPPVLHPPFLHAQGLRWRPFRRRTRERTKEPSTAKAISQRVRACVRACATILHQLPPRAHAYATVVAVQGVLHTNITGIATSPRCPCLGGATTHTLGSGDGSCMYQTEFG